MSRKLLMKKYRSCAWCINISVLKVIYRSFFDNNMNNIVEKNYNYLLFKILTSEAGIDVLLLNSKRCYFFLCAIFTLSLLTSITGQICNSCLLFSYFSSWCFFWCTVVAGYFCCHIIDRYIVRLQKFIMRIYIVPCATKWEIIILLKILR